MRNAIKKTARFCLRTTLTLALLVIVIIALIHLSLIIAVSYLNSGKAHQQMQAYISGILQESGYNATFDAVSYYPARGLTVRNLRVSDAQGPFLLLNHASLTVDFGKLPLHELDLSLRAGTLNLLRTPYSPEPAEQTAPLAPFELPDIYFKTIRISSLSLKKLVLDQSIFGSEMIFSPSLETQVGLNRVIETKTALLLRPEARIGGVALPDEIELSGRLNPATLSFEIDQLGVSSSDYNISGNGKGSLAHEAPLDLTLRADYADLKPLTQGNLESGSIDLHAGGSLEAPELKASGQIKTATLKERGLNDFDFTLSPIGDLESAQASFKINTQYQDHPAELTGILGYTSNLIEIRSFKATAPEVEISGEASLPLDTALPTGELHISARDLSYYQNLLQMDIAGALDTDISFSPRAESLSADISARLKSGRFNKLSVASIEAKAGFPDIRRPWPDAIDAKITKFSATDDMRLDNATIVLSQKENDTYGLSLSGAGSAPMPVSFKGSADISGLTGALPSIKDIDLTTRLNKSSVSLKGEASAETINIKLSTKEFSAFDLPVSLPETAKNIRLSGDIAVTGNPAAPITAAKFTARGFDTGKYKGLQVSAEASHQADRAAVSLKGTGTGIRNLQADIHFPLSFSLSPFVFDFTSTKNLEGSFATEVQLDAIAALFLPATQSLAGALNADGKIAGTFAAPDINANIALRDGRFRDEGQGIELAHMSASATLRNSALSLHSFTATDNESGNMNARGTVSLGSASTGSIDLSMKNFHLPKSQMADGHIDADLSLESVASGFSVKGNVDIADMNITIPESFSSTIPELNIIKKQKEKSRSLSTELAIKVDAPNQVFVRGWGLDAEFGGSLDITGDLSAPQFNGTLSSKRGRFEEFGKRFTLAHADLRFQGDIPPSPYLDVEATVPSGDITASVLLSGPVTKPAISFSSSPALPQDEVLSRILFNKDSSQITPFQAIQLAQMIQRFAGKGRGGGFDPLGKLRAATGLDDISVDTDASGQTNVGVGKYLTDKVYLEVEKGKAANSGNASIQIEVTPQINIQSKIGQDSQTGGGIFWKRDY